MFVQLAALVLEMQKEDGVKTFKQSFQRITEGQKDQVKCPMNDNCATAGVDGAFTPTSIVEWIMSKLMIESHLGKFVS